MALIVHKSTFQECVGILRTTPRQDDITTFEGLYRG